MNEIPRSQPLFKHYTLQELDTILEEVNRSVEFTPVAIPVRQRIKERRERRKHLPGNAD